MTIEEALANGFWFAVLDAKKQDHIIDRLRPLQSEGVLLSLVQAFDRRRGPGRVLKITEEHRIGICYNRTLEIYEPYYKSKIVKGKYINPELFDLERAQPDPWSAIVVGPKRRARKNWEQYLISFKITEGRVRQLLMADQLPI